MRDQKVHVVVLLDGQLGVQGLRAIDKLLLLGSACKGVAFMVLVWVVVVLEVETRR